MAVQSNTPQRRKMERSGLYITIGGRVTFNPLFLQSSPAFLHVAQLWTAGQDWPSFDELHEDCGVRFVLQEPRGLHFEDQYIVQIARTKTVPTRIHDWHDLCNALTWRMFPQSKWVLNTRHYRALCSRAQDWDIRAPRTTEEDICTLISENAVVIAYSSFEDAQAIRDFQWKRLFWDNREGLTERMELFFFGHALLSKARQPYIGMTGHGILLEVAPSFFKASTRERLRFIDEQLCVILDAQSQGQRAGSQRIAKTRDLQPFPILGFPGFDDRANAESFYENRFYFRDGRRSS